MQEKEEKKEDDRPLPRQPANCSYFICKASNKKYFKWLLLSLLLLLKCFLVVAHQPFDRFPYLWMKSDHFLSASYDGGVFFILYCFCYFSLVWYLKNKKKMFMTAMTFFFFIFLHFGCCSFFSLASSICLCHNALFISNLHNNNKKKWKLIIVPTSAFCISWVEEEEENLWIKYIKSTFFPARASTRCRFCDRSPYLFTVFGN